MLELHVATAKVPRHGSVESGDTVEIIERPGGGFSVVLVDGQGSGRGAKTLSNLVITRAISQIKDGARDEVVARNVHDYLYTYRMGQVAATLNILSVDFQSGSLLMTRNNPAPFFVLDSTGARTYGEACAPIGLYAITNPLISNIPLRPYLYIVFFSDGLLKAGERYGGDLELGNFLASWPAREARSADSLCEALLGRALELDHGRPSDDMTVVVLAALLTANDRMIRRMHVSFPMEQPEDHAPAGEHGRERLDLPLK